MYECFYDFGTRCNRRPIDCFPNNLCTPCLPSFNPCRDSFCERNNCLQAPCIDVGFCGGCNCFRSKLNISFPVCGWVCFSLDNNNNQFFLQTVKTDRKYANKSPIKVMGLVSFYYTHYTSFTTLTYLSGWCMVNGLVPRILFMDINSII